MNITDINTDDPNAIAGHIWEHTPDNAERTYYEGVQDQCATVTVGQLEFAVGYDPGDEDGITWAINLIEDGTRDGLYYGGWAPGDTETADEEITGIITVLNGGEVNW